MIGHELREAMQRFATELVEAHEPPDVDTDPAHTKKRLAAVVALHQDRLGERRAAMLLALLDYQGAANDLLQRLEHADQKENEPATWDDARSACFQTVNVMVEFDRLLHP